LRSSHPPRRRPRIEAWALAPLLAALALGGCNSDVVSGDYPDLAGGGSDLAGQPGDLSGGGQRLKTVFIMLFENHNWSSFKGSADAKYLNGTLLPKTAHAEQYFNPPGNHPSEPNYLWLEAGSNLGVTNDNAPSANHQATTDHLVSQLDAAGISWLSYQEDLPAGCPLDDNGLYAVRHNPVVFFDDVTNGGNAGSQKCIDHMRPLSQLGDDLAGKNGKSVARYNFITPNLCNDGHGQTLGTTCFGLTSNLVKLSDDFMAKWVPTIEGSSAFADGGVLFITWDEGEGTFNPSDGPIGMIVDSPKAKPNYSSMTQYSHSSTLRSIETVFGVPFLRDAANATDLAELFTSFP